MANSKKLTIADYGKEALPILGCFAGIIAGNVAVNMANKVLKNDPNDPKLSIKKALPPLALVVGGSVGTLHVDNPMLKSVMKGVAIAGAIKATKMVLPQLSALSGLGLTPVSAAANTDRWVYQENTPVSGVGFPDLGNVQSPESSNGYYIDAPAYMQGAEMQYADEQQFNGAEEEMGFGEIEIL